MSDTGIKEGKQLPAAWLPRGLWAKKQMRRLNLYHHTAT